MPTPELRQEKYAAIEIERRWIAGAEAVRLVEGSAYCEIEDLYVAGTSMRLRAVRSLDQQPVFKLCKKYGKPKDGFSEAITNLYLSETEHRLLAARLHGNRACKRRYALAGGALDVYADPAQTVVFEMEFGSEAEAAAYSPPSFVAQEVTHAQAFSGAGIAAASVALRSSGR